MIRGVIIRSIFETFLKDFKLDVKYIASKTVVLPALFSPHKIVISLSKEILQNLIDLKSWIDKDSIRTTRHALA